MSFDENDVESAIPRRFEKIAARFPDRIAVTHLGKSLTYAVLDRLAHEAACRIADRIPDDGKPIALCLHQGASQVIATLAVLKAGRSYLPLDPAIPEARNQQMLERSGAVWVLTNDLALKTAEQLTGSDRHMLNLDTCATSEPTKLPDREIQPADIACILYTSGSTGHPKGVMHSHRTLLHNALRHHDAFGITPDDRQTLLYTPSVYGGQRDMYNALLNGASLNIYDLKAEGIQGLADWLEASGISIYCSVATVFRQFCKTLDASRSFPHLRLVKLGGEATHRTDVDGFRKYFPVTCQMHCGFGSTETGLARNFFVSGETQFTGESVPLGYPIANMEVLLLDEDGHEVAQNQMGEIVIRSPYVALGYWREPEQTARAFANDLEDGNKRVYRTGDLGIIREDGCLVHLGRRDQQVKIKGYRIEPAEIEQALLRGGRISETVVTSCKDQLGNEELAAYVVGVHHPLLLRSLRAELASRLPGYMVPAHFIRLDALPRLPNGKVDRQALPDPGRANVSDELEYIPPTSAVELHLAAIWSEILGGDQVGRSDNFFAIGGESLNALVMLAAVERRFQVNVPVSSLMLDPTIGALARIIESTNAEQASAVVVPLRLSGSKRPLFCVHGVYGGCFFYRKLVERLNHDQPFYALQPPSLNGRRFENDSIEAVAERYILEIRAVQPRGPYRLGGFSFGGKIAFEMARQLSEGNEAVELLLIFDSHPPSHRGRGQSNVRNAAPGHSVLEEQDGSAAIEQHERLIGDVGPRLYLLRRRLQAGWLNLKTRLTHERLRFGSTLDAEGRPQYIAWNHHRVDNRYFPKPYDRDIVLLHTRSRQSTILDGWQACTTGTVHTYSIPGEHKQIFDPPGIGPLAATISRILEDIDSDPLKNGASLPQLSVGSA